MADTSIRINAVPGRLELLDALERRLANLRTQANNVFAGWETTPQGIRRQGYSGGLPPASRPPTVDPLTNQPRQGGLRPWPANIAPSPFVGAGGPSVPWPGGGATPGARGGAGAAPAGGTGVPPGPPPGPTPGTTAGTTPGTTPGTGGGGGGGRRRGGGGGSGAPGMPPGSGPVLFTITAATFTNATFNTSVFNITTVTSAIFNVNTITSAPFTIASAAAININAMSTGAGGTTTANWNPQQFNMQTLNMTSGGGGGPSGPGGPGGASGGGGRGGGGVRGAMGTVGRFGRRLGGLALGYGAFQFLDMGLSSYEEHYRGVLQTGLALDTQYKKIDDTLLHLRQTYQLTNRTALEAMKAIGEATGGQMLGVDAAMRVGRAYDLEQEAPGMFATMAGMSTQRVPNLAELTGQYNQYMQGRTPLGRRQWLGQVMDVANVGGLQAAPLSPAEYGQITQRMTMMGGRFAQHPAEAYAQEFAGMQAPAGALGESVNFTALGNLAQRQQWVKLGDQWVNLRDPTGMMIARQQAAQIPEVRGEIARTAQRMAGGNEGLGVTLYGAATNTENLLEARTRYLNELRPGGGPRPANLVQEEATIAKTLVGQGAGGPETPEGKGLRLREEEVNKLRTDEMAMIDKLKTSQQNLIDTVIKTNETWNDTHDVVKTTQTAFANLNEKVMATAGVFATIFGGPLGAAIGVPLIAGAAGKNLESQYPGLFDSIVNAITSATMPTGTQTSPTLTRQPTKQGP